MHPILQQILDLLTQAPLSQTGKDDIRHTIRTEYYEPAELVTVTTHTQRVRLAIIEDTDCDCPITHKHSHNGGAVYCFECACAYTPEERKPKRRVNLLE